MGGNLRTSLGYLQRNDVETRGLRCRGQSHLIGLVGSLHTLVVKVTDVGATVRFTSLHVPSGTVGGVVVVETEKPIGIESLQRHQRLVEVGSVTAALACHGLVPHLSYSGDVVVVFVDEVMEPVTLIAVPLMRESIVVRLAEHRDTLVVHQVGVRLGSLPLGRLFPDSLAVAASQVEARVVGRGVLVTAMLGIAHIVERVTHLVRHRMTHRLAGGRAEPQGADLKVIAAAIAHPVGGVVHQHHHLVLSQVRLHGVHKAELVDFEVVECLALLEQVLLVHTVGRRRLRGQGVAVELIPEHDDVVGLHAAALRPRVLVVGVTLFVEQRVRALLAPFHRDVNGLLRYYVAN